MASSDVKPKLQSFKLKKIKINKQINKQINK